MFSFDLDFQRDIKKNTVVSISYQIIYVENASDFSIGDIDYARLNIIHKYYEPIWRDLVFGFNIEGGYAKAFGDTNETPFFQNFYAGGPRSLRGFESNTLGPRSTNPPCFEFWVQI